MINVAASTIALPPGDHDAHLSGLCAIGIDALEVAPSRRWDDTWHGLGNAQVESYRRAIEAAGLKVCGLHSLLFDHKDLLLFADDDTRSRLADFLVHLSALCRDLGGRTLIWGGGRLRGDVSNADATARAIDFMAGVCRRIEDHGTVYCFEPLGPNDSDFINSALEALDICRAIDHPSMAMQLDAKALIENGEVSPDVFAAVASELEHVHANEPGLTVIGSSGSIDHARIGTLLRETGYNGYVSAEQRMLNADTWAEDLAISVAAIRRHYCHGEAT